MKLLDRISAALDRRAAARLDAVARRKGFAQTGSPISLWLSGGDTNPALYQESIREPYAQHPTVYLAVKAVASTIAELEREIHPTASPDGEDIKDHWLLDLLESPDPESPGGDLIEMSLTFLETTGEAFIWHRDIRRGTTDRGRRPHELWLIDPAAMMHKPDRSGAYIEAWEYSAPTGHVLIDPAEVTHLRYFNPYDGWRGLSPLRAIMVEYTKDHKAALWSRAWFDNAAIPPVIFKSKKSWADEDRESFVSSWDNKFKGASRSGRAAALPDDIDVTVLKVTSQEMEFLEGRRFTREQILSVFGVPPAMAGVYEYANYANSREQSKHFWAKLKPKTRYLERSLTRSLLQVYDPTMTFTFDVDAVLSEIAAADYADKVTTARAMWDMGFPAADVNERLNLGMKTAGKPWLLMGWLPFSVQPADIALEPPPPEPAPAPAPGTEPADDTTPVTEQAVGPDGLQGALDRVRRALVKVKGGRRANQWKVRFAMQGPLSRSYQRKLRSWMWGLRAETMTKMSRFTGPRTYTGARVMKDLLDEQSDIDAIMFSAAEAALKLVAISKPMWLAAMQMGARVLTQESGIESSFTHLDPAVMAFLAEKAVKVTRISETIREQLRGQVAEGINRGETVDQIADRVQSVFEASRNRAMTIARTETAQAVNGGHYIAMRQAGINYHEWLSSQDDVVRDSHISADAEVVALGETFSTMCRFPGDPSGPAEEVINCRCVTVPLASSDIVGGVEDAEPATTEEE